MSKDRFIIIFPRLLLALLLSLFILTGCNKQDEHLIAACQQELDQAYLRVGKLTTRDFETLTKIQKEANGEIFKMIQGQEGVSISTNVLKDHILIIISRNGEVTSRTEWRAPG